MPDAHGNFKGMTVPADAWERIFGAPSCYRCDELDNGTHPDHRNIVGVDHDVDCLRNANRDNRPTDK